MTQLELDGTVPLAPPTVKVTERQRFVLELLERKQPCPDDEIGAALHAWKGKHPDDVRCQWCADDGKGVCRALEHKGLVERVRGVGWQLVGHEIPHDPTPEIGGPGDLPDGF